MAKAEKVDSGAHDSLVPLGGNLSSPRNARGGDWTVGGKGVAGNEQSGREAGFMEGLNELAKAPCGNRNLEDDGDMTPSVWGKGGKAFPVKTNDGESETSAVSKASDMAFFPGVNLESGALMPAGAQTRVKETVDYATHIPSR
jgi:hypothetical protein